MSAVTQALKGQYMSAMGIAHQPVTQALKGLNTITMGIARRQKKIRLALKGWHIIIR